jgi:Na+-transporting methylmalonyl-CoA/oxaloacetate decarboxylase beta subunit
LVGWHQPRVEIHPAIYLAAFLYTALAPLVMPVIERGLVKKYLEKLKNKKSPYSYTFTYAIVRLTFATISYTFGLFAFVLSKDILWMLGFYPVGIFWSYKLWPYRAQIDSFLERIQPNVPYTG